MLASHYLDAFNAAPDVDGAEDARAKARELFVRAGERAESLGAPGESQRYLAQAAELTDDVLGRAALLDRAGQMGMRAGLNEQAAAHFEQAMAIYDAAGDTHAAARVTSRLAYVDERAGRHELAIERMEEAMAVIGADEPDEDVALLTVRLGNARMFVGRVEPASALVERALDMGEALGLPEILVRGWSAKALLVGPHRRQEAEVLLRAASELALEQGLTERAGACLGNLSDLAFGQDRYEHALGVPRAVAGARAPNRRPPEHLVCDQRVDLRAVSPGQVGRGGGRVCGAAPGPAPQWAHPHQPADVRAADPPLSRGARFGPCAARGLSPAREVRRRPGAVVLRRRIARPWRWPRAATTRR